MSRIGCPVSVVIRTRNVERCFRRLLWSLSHQTLCPSEIVVVDNFSSKHKLDEMADLLSLAKERFFNNEIRMKLVPMTDEEFSHAYSTNLGVHFSAFDLVCITNGHSWPLSRFWLEKGATHFRDSKVAGVAGYSTPHEDGTLWEKLAFGLGWKRLNELSRAYVNDDFFSTVNCLLRKGLWERYPFDEELTFRIRQARKFGGEDHDWATEMLARGYRIVVEPEFAVYHSHGETLSQLFHKYLVWRRIRKDVESFERPRDSSSRVESLKPVCYDL
jgi:rhamnosyltransferase